MATVEGGILRGQGRQHLGGITNVVVYWFIALPAGLALTFKADWRLYGLWAGMVGPPSGIACAPRRSFPRTFTYLVLIGSYWRWDFVR